MFRRQRATEPDPASRNLGNILKPMPIMNWGGQAMHYLGVPVVLGVSIGLSPRTSYKSTPSFIVETDILYSSTL
jgi:hypothetical protein